MKLSRQQILAMIEKYDRTKMQLYQTTKKAERAYIHGQLEKYVILAEQWCRELNI
jgi:hypothetical protein